ncbi:hypothetical protein VTN00DRAFT_3723 [Thermoascus crustaceus]|uniref:uncharacterized protein n=1 Tax=Thermoascus crustaceus TaxID=5088 RepID=UPI003743D4AE
MCYYFAGVLSVCIVMTKHRSTPSGSFGEGLALVTAGLGLSRALLSRDMRLTSLSLFASGEGRTIFGLHLPLLIGERCQRNDSFKQCRAASSLLHLTFPRYVWIRIAPKASWSYKREPPRGKL